MGFGGIPYGLDAPANLKISQYGRKKNQNRYAEHNEKGVHFLTVALEARAPNTRRLYTLAGRTALANYRVSLPNSEFCAEGQRRNHLLFKALRIFLGCGHELKANLEVLSRCAFVTEKAAAHITRIPNLVEIAPDRSGNINEEFRPRTRTSGRCPSRFLALFIVMAYRLDHHFGRLHRLK